MAPFLFENADYLTLSLILPPSSRLRVDLVLIVALFIEIKLLMLATPPGELLSHFGILYKFYIWILFMLVPVEVKVFDWFGIFCKPMGISWVSMMDPMILKQTHA